jgi:hypothetical protein
MQHAVNRGAWQASGSHGLVTQDKACHHLAFVQPLSWLDAARAPVEATGLLGINAKLCLEEVKAMMTAIKAAIVLAKNAKSTGQSMRLCPGCRWRLGVSLADHRPDSRAGQVSPSLSPRPFWDCLASPPQGGR